MSLNYKLLLATSNNYSKQDTGPGIKGRSEFSALCTANHQFFDISQTGLKGKKDINDENSSREHVPTQHAQRLPGKFESPPPSFVATATASSPDP